LKLFSLFLFSNKKLLYNAPKIKDGILGSFDSKKNDGNIKQAVIPGEKSKVCTIL
jgi:hypothetical protein